MARIKFFVSLTIVFGCLCLAGIGSVERYYGSPHGSRWMIDFYLAKFDIIFLIFFIISAGLSIRELIKTGHVRHWARSYPRQISSIGTSLVIFAFLSHDIWYGTPLWILVLYITVLIFPILVIAIGRNMGDFLFYAVLFVYGVAALTHTISSDQYWVTFSIISLSSFARTNSAAAKYALVGMLGLGYITLYMYLFSSLPEKLFDPTSISFPPPSSHIFALKGPWLFYAFIISAPISMIIALRQKNGKYINVEIIGDKKHIELYSKTTSDVSSLMLFLIPFHMWLYHLSLSPNFAVLFPTFAFLASALVVGIAFAGIVRGLRQHRDRIKLIAHPYGKISFPTKTIASDKLLPTGVHCVTEVNVEFQPESLEEFVANQRKGDVFLAGGTGPEGAAMLGASVAMTAADGIRKAAAGIGENILVGMRNYQRKKNGWHVTIHMVSENGEDRVLFVEGVQKAVADELQKLLAA